VPFFEGDLAGQSIDGTEQAMKRRIATRNPERMRELILAAALKEFSRNGFAGARVDVVARKAGVNKRMLYHYFSDKRGLFEEVLRRRMSERDRWAAAAPEDPAEKPPYWFDRMWRDADWIRLLEWEALQVADSGIIAKKERQEFLQSILEQIREGQKNGRIAEQNDAAQILLSMMALTTFPIAFPQLTKMVTGLAANGEQFHQRRLKFLRAFAAAFRPLAKVPRAARGSLGELKRGQAR
jgi:TetR/AcrR family transcriptional regulator